MTSSVLPSASFSFATRFISPRSAAGEGIAASAARAHLGGDLDELGREEVGHDLEVGAAGERAAERFLSFGSLSVVEVRPRRLDEHARAALGIARRRGGALELERGLSELAGVDGLCAPPSRATRSLPGRGRGARRRRTAADREEDALRFTDAIVAIPSSTRCEGSRTSRLRRRRSSWCTSCGRRGSR